MTTESVNTATAEAATEKAELPLGSLQLLGIVTRKDEAEALLRQPNGNTFWAKTGSDTPYGTVIALDEKALVLDNGRGQRRLQLLG